MFYMSNPTFPLSYIKNARFFMKRYFDMDILTNAAHQIRHLCQTICCLQQLSLVLLCMKFIHCTIYNLNKTKIKERWILIFFHWDNAMQCINFLCKGGSNYKILLHITNSWLVVSRKKSKFHDLVTIKTSAYARKNTAYKCTDDWRVMKNHEFIF